LKKRSFWPKTTCRTCKLTANRGKDFGFLSLVYRHTWTTEGQRNDVGLDLLFYVL